MVMAVAMPRFASCGGFMLPNVRKYGGMRFSGRAKLSSRDEATIIELPCLPFMPAEVLVPCSTKTLHLYEARFLALLEEVMRRFNNMFVHIVVQSTGSQRQSEFAVKYACLCHVESVKRLDVGALVSIRGIGRTSVIALSQTEPFLKGVVVPMKDEPAKDFQAISSSIQHLKSTLAEVQQLQIKLKTSKTETLQTPLGDALQWAERAVFSDNVTYFLPSREERISFAALQPVAGASTSELQRLLQQRLLAMESNDTSVRLSTSLNYALETRSWAAAKLAIQSLQL